MDDSPIGRLGVLSVATRGDGGPGEVVLSLRGSTESYLAWSDDPIPRGTEVVVVDKRGPRTLHVESCEEPDPIPAPQAGTGSTRDAGDAGAQSRDDAVRGELEL